MPGTSTEAFITGFAVNPGLDSAVDELIIIFEADDGTDHYLRAFSDVPMGPSLNSILSAGRRRDSGWPVRLAVPGVDPDERLGHLGVPPPPPTLVFPAALDNDARGPDGHLYIYPPILAPTTYAVQDLITGTSGGGDNSSVTGQVITYGSRVICLVGIKLPPGLPAAASTRTRSSTLRTPRRARRMATRRTSSPRRSPGATAAGGRCRWASSCSSRRTAAGSSFTATSTPSPFSDPHAGRAVDRRLFRPGRADPVGARLLLRATRRLDLERWQHGAEDQRPAPRLLL